MMQVFGGSVDLAQVGEKAADFFLHAGYISAYPRPLWPDMVELGPPKVELDLVEAFRLQGETVAQALPAPDMTGFAASVASSGEWWMTLLGIAGFFGALLAAYAFRGKLAHARVAAPIAMIALAVGLSGMSCSEEELPDEVPWEETTVQAYENPEAATVGLLHGIIADGIINVGQPVDSLANIQDEVGLPTTQLTDGQAYALATYGLDGWGHAFRLTRQQGNAYEVRSAGADGEFDNGDDLTIEVSQADNGSWEYQRHAFYLRKYEGDLALFYHRWSGKMFEYNEEVKAKVATGGKLFDYFTRDMMNSCYSNDGAPDFDTCYGDHANGHEPLVLLVF